MRALYGVWGACLLLVGASAYAQVNQNQLTAVGPVNPATGFPVWYEDANGLRLELCTDTSGFCLEVPPDPTQPPSVPGNFPGEAFWWAADASMPTNGDGEALLVLALEAAFTTEAPAAGEQIVFGRIRVRIDNLVAGATYTVTHPFGVDSFVAQAAGRRGINVTEDIGCAAGPCDFSLALNSRVGPFLVWDPAVPPAAPPGYIGDPNVLHPVVGSPFGTNIFRVEGPNVGGPGVNVIQTNLFAVQGKVFVPPPVGTLGVSTSLLDFGTALLGETRGPQAISLENLGNGALEIGSLALAGGNTGDFDLVLDPCSGATLLPGASCVVTVSFTPSAEGTRSTLLQIPTSDPAGPQQVGLTGRGRDPSTPVGSVGPINLDHGFPEFYEDVTGLRLRLCLDADGECLETVPNPALPPAVPGNFPAEAFWWAADADMPTSGDGEARLVLAMEAAFVTEEPLPGDQMTFGRVRVRAENVVPGAIYTVTHPFGVDTVIAEDDGSINVTEDIGCASSPCDFAAALDSRVTTFLRWDPAVPPAAPTGQIGSPGTPHPVIGSPFGTNVFRIEGPDIGGPGVDVIQTDLFNVQGKLYEPVGPVVRVAPQLVDFGTVLVGGPVARSVTVENVGTAPALLGTVTVGGAAAADYVLSDGCSGQTLAAGGTCAIGVQFTPSAADRREAFLSVPSNGAHSPQEVILLGRGLASTGPVVIPVTQPEFGAVRVSTQSLGSFVVSNGGGAPLNISSATIGGANAADFRVVTDACTGTPLAPAGTCEIQVQFAPLALGARVATLTLESDDPEGPKVLPLTGVGTSPLLTLNAAALDFGQQRIGTSGRRTLTLTNTGTGPLNILQLGTIGGDAGDFSVSATTCSSTLAQGASCSLELSFRPTAAGARSSLLQIVTDAPTSPDFVELKGEGLEGEPGGGDICIER